MRGLWNKLEPPDGAPLLGLDGIVVKCHGNAGAKGFAAGIRIAVNLAQSEFASEIKRNLEQLTKALAEDPGVKSATSETIE